MPFFPYQLNSGEHKLHEIRKGEPDDEIMDEKELRGADEFKKRKGEVSKYLCANK